jgi:hypothetical protein
MASKSLILAAAIIGVLLAAAILIVFRWQISAVQGLPKETGPGLQGYVYRLDRWTGSITVCFGGIPAVPPGTAGYSSCLKIPE